MKIGIMISDISNSLFRRPITELYPFERRETPESLRGMLHWNSENCTGCGLCAKDCPANAIDLIVLDKKAKRFVLSYHPDRCTFCAQCVHSCRQGCLEMSNEEWELASLDKDQFHVLYGVKEDVENILAGSPLPDVDRIE
ncbi:MAG TPA: 4Fe-4S binding protein [Anaerolineae bacterium]|nr:4Fe-4S binding protein [Anaerolineae bacterium]